MKFKDWWGEEHALPQNKSFSWRPSAFGLVIDGSRVILVKAKMHGMWELPGGAIELNETVEKALVREVREETGYEVLIESAQPIYIENNYLYIPDLDEYFRTLPMVFLAKLRKGKRRAVILHEKEVTEVGWFDLSDLPKPINPMASKAIERYKKLASSLS